MKHTVTLLSALVSKSTWMVHHNNSLILPKIVPQNALLVHELIQLWYWWKEKHVQSFELKSLLKFHVKYL